MKLVCNLNAIAPAAQPRYQDLVKRIRAAIRENGKKELPDGFAFHLNSEGITLPEVAEWITMERLCCPFLTLELIASGSQDDWTLKLSGPTGVKPILEAAFPMR